MSSWFNLFYRYILVFLFVPALFDSTVLGREASLPEDEAWCLESSWPHEKSRLSPDPAMRFGRLSNGFRYVLMENREPKDRVAVYLDVQAGSIYEKAHERGYAHFLEHMLFNGSTHFKPGELIQYFQSIGMDFGGDANAHTSYDETVYNLFLPKGDSEELEKGFLVIADFCQGALLLESEVEKERGVILSEKMARDSVSYRTRLAHRKEAFRGTLLPARETIGIEKTLLAADSAALTDFYRKWYRPEKMILIVVGDFEKNNIEPMIQKYFGAIPAGNPIPDCPELGQLENDSLKGFYYYEPEGGKVSVSIDSYWNKEKQDDSLELQTLLLKNYFATRILQRRLERIKEKEGGIFSSPHVYSGNLLDAFGYSGLGVTTSADNWQKSIQILETNVRQMLEYGVTADEVALMKTELRSTFEAAALVADTRSSDELARQIIWNLNNNRVIQSPEMEKELYLPIIETFTPVDIDAACASLWEHPSKLVSVTGNVIIKSENPGEAIAAVYLRSSETVVNKAAENKKHIFPYLKTPMISNQPVSSHKFDQVGVEVVSFKNGVVLNMKKTEFEKNKLEVALSFGPGQQSEPVAGIGILAEAIVKTSGSGALSDTEMENVLAGTSVDYDFDVEKTHFSLIGEATNNEAEILFQVLQTLFLDPGFRPEAYENVMMRYKLMYERMQTDIYGAEALYADQFFAGGNKLFGIPEWRHFSQLSLAQVRDWLIPYYNTAALEISVVGDFNSDEITSLVSTYFGTLPQTKTYAIHHNPIVFPSGKTVELKISSKINKALLLFGWETEDYSDIATTRRLSMLANIFEERLRQTIREELGASYSPGVYNQLSRIIPEYGVMRAQMIVEPEQLETVTSAVLRICDDFSKNKISEDELERAKKPVLTSLHDLMRSNSYWLSSVLTLSSKYPQQLIWPTTILEDFASITVKEMNEYAGKYLLSKDAAIVTITPDS